MWLSGQAKRPADSGESRTGVITMSAGELAVRTDSEHRGVELYGPAGFRWSPQTGDRVLVVQGRGEIPCIVGVRQDAGRPEQVEIEAERIALKGEQVTLEAAKVDLGTGVTVGGMPLEQYVAAIVRQYAGGTE